MAKDEAMTSTSNLQVLEDAIAGKVILAMIAHQIVSLTPKFHIGAKMDATTQRCATVMAVRQFRNNQEARAKKSANGLTQAQIVEAWSTYKPDVALDSPLDEAALRVGLKALNKARADTNAETRSQIVAKVLANTKFRQAILDVFPILIEESKEERKATKGAKVEADLSALD